MTENDVVRLRGAVVEASRKLAPNPEAAKRIGYEAIETSMKSEAMRKLYQAHQPFSRLTLIDALRSGLDSYFSNHSIGTFSGSFLQSFRRPGSTLRPAFSKKTLRYLSAARKNKDKDAYAVIPSAAKPAPMSPIWMRGKKRSRARIIGNARRLFFGYARFIAEFS